VTRVPRQFLVPAGTRPRPCPKCHQPTYRVVTVPKGLIALDCGAPGQRAPSASADGAGIPHVIVCARTAARATGREDPVDG
jgi:hypothetical protein